MNAPERIVAWVWDLPYPSKVNGGREWDEWDSGVFPTEQDCHDYIRADLYDAQAAEIADLRRQLAEARDKALEVAVQMVGIWSREDGGPDIDPENLEALPDYPRGWLDAIYHAQRQIRALKGAAK